LTTLVVVVSEMTEGPQIIMDIPRDLSMPVSEIVDHLGTLVLALITVHVHFKFLTSPVTNVRV